MDPILKNIGFGLLIILSIFIIAYLVIVIPVVIFIYLIGTKANDNQITTSNYNKII